MAMKWTLPLMKVESCDETGTVTDHDGNSYDYLCYGDTSLD